jgi:hypothetical protein
MSVSQSVTHARAHTGLLADVWGPGTCFGLVAGAALLTAGLVRAVIESLCIHCLGAATQ